MTLQFRKRLHFVPLHYDATKSGSGILFEKHSNSTLTQPTEYHGSIFLWYTYNLIPDYGVGCPNSDKIMNHITVKTREAMCV
jgi:hypothetical protein